MKPSVVVHRNVRPFRRYRAEANGAPPAGDAALAMIVYPAMDLMDGRCVRLAHGRFDDVASYLADPVEAVLGFEEAGAEWVHVVDVDGAREGGPRQHGLIVDIALSVSMKLQVAGGFRERSHLRRMFDAGVDRVVIGNLAARQPALASELLADFGGDHLVLAFDVKIVDGAPIVLTGAGADPTGRCLWELVELYPAARHILLTDVDRDAGADGPNLALMAEAAHRLPDLQVQASGGVASTEHLHALAAAGAAGAVVGKALWDGRITLADALQSARA